MGNRQSIRVWRDPWLPRDYSRRPITRKGNCRIKWVSDLLQDDGTWRVDKVQEHFWPIDVEMILKIRTSASLESDFLAWHPDRLGKFSVRSVYHLVVSLAETGDCSSSTEVLVNKSWKRIWACNVPQKVRIFAWKAISNSLPTMKNKKKRNLELLSTCCICGAEEEDVAHALCHCQQARNLWSAMYSARAISHDVNSAWSGTDWILNLLEVLPKEEDAMFLMLMWRIWHNRNEITHGKSIAPVAVSQRFIFSYVSSLTTIKQYPQADIIRGKQVAHPDRIRLPSQAPPAVSSPRRWEKPSTGWMKLNVDGSFQASDGKGGIGAVLRDSSGNVIFAACGSMLVCGSAMEADYSRAGRVLQWRFNGRSCLSLWKLIA